MINSLFLIIAIAFSAFFSGSEIAFFSLSDAKVFSLLQKKVKRAELVRKLKANPEKLLTTILIGNNLVNIGASALTTYWATEVFGSNGVGIATGAMTLLILTFGEIMPKSIASRYSIKIALLASLPMYTLTIIFSPISIFFITMINFFNRLFGARDPMPKVSEEEVRAMARMGAKEGVFEQFEHEVIDNIFTLNDKTVSKSMTKREDMEIIDGDDNISDVVRDVNLRKYSRLPVFLGHEDNIVGFLLLKDVLKYPRSKWSGVKVKEIVRNPLFSSPQTILIDLFEQFIENKLHIAVVVDNKKKVVGLITIEDIIEEVMGDIDDEVADERAD